MSSDCVSDDVELNRLLLDQLADKWTILILQVFCGGPEPVRFNEIKRRVQGVSQKTLTRCLRRLERNGILERRVVEAAPLGVEYSITPLGWTIAEPFGRSRDGRRSICRMCCKPRRGSMGASKIKVCRTIHTGSGCVVGHPESESAQRQAD